jgi:hypothetical protein
MHFEVDLDPTHSVIRLTVIEEVVSLECAEACYKFLSQISSGGGPYAAVFDLSAARDTTITTQMVRNFASRTPSIPGGRPQVVVGKAPVIYGLARLFQTCEEGSGAVYDVVHTLAEAYEIVGAAPEDFTERLFPEVPAAA